MSKVRKKPLVVIRGDRLKDLLGLCKDHGVTRFTGEGYSFTIEPDHDQPRIALPGPLHPKIEDERTYDDILFHSAPDGPPQPGDPVFVTRKPFGGVMPAAKAGDE